MNTPFVLAVHHDPSHPTKPWVIGIEVGPAVFRPLDRYETEERARQVYKRMRSTFRQFVDANGVLK